MWSSKKVETCYLQASVLLRGRQGSARGRAPVQALQAMRSLSNPCQQAPQHSAGLFRQTHLSAALAGAQGQVQQPQAQ